MKKIGKLFAFVTFVTSFLSSCTFEINYPINNNLSSSLSNEYKCDYSSYSSYINTSNSSNYTSFDSLNSSSSTSTSRPSSSSSSSSTSRPSSSSSSTSTSRPSSSSSSSSTSRPSSSSSSTSTSKPSSSSSSTSTSRPSSSSSSTSSNTPIDDKLELQVIAVEMTGTYGDSYLIKYGDFEMLVDAGTTYDKTYVQNTLKEFVEDDELEILMLSHFHTDHIGSMTSTSFFNNINIKINTIIDNGANSTTNAAKSFMSMRNSFVSNGTKYYNYYNILNDSSISTKWYIDQEKDIYLEFFDTGTVSKPNTTPNDPNDSSIAYALNCKNNKWLFTGDLSSTSESTLVDNITKINSNYFKESNYVVFKAGHHGSNGSNSDKLLSFIKPDMVFITTGIISENRNNKKITSQHPYSGALSRMKKHTNKVYWTGINGTIILTSDGDDVAFDARGRTVDYYYKGSKVSREDERYINMFESKWYSMM